MPFGKLKGFREVREFRGFGGCGDFGRKKRPASLIETSLGSNILFNGRGEHPVCLLPMRSVSRFPWLYYTRNYYNFKYNFTVWRCPALFIHIPSRSSAALWLTAYSTNFNLLLSKLYLPLPRFRRKIQQAVYQNACGFSAVLPERMELRSRVLDLQVRNFVKKQSFRL